MITRIGKNIFIIFIFLFSLTSCLKPCEKDYWFEIPFTVSLTSDSIRVGDTLWVESEYAFSLTDLNSNTMVDVDSFQFLLALTVNTMDSIEQNASDSFTFFSTIGELNSFELGGGEIRQLLYDISESKNKIKLGIVPSEPGLFVFSFFTWFHKNSNVDQEQFDRKVDFDRGQCQEFLFLTIQTHSQTENNNFQLFQEGNNSYFKQIDLQSFNEYGTFCVKVIE